MLFVHHFVKNPEKAALVNYLADTKDKVQVLSMEMADFSKYGPPMPNFEEEQRLE